MDFHSPNTSPQGDRSAPGSPFEEVKVPRDTARELFADGHFVAPATALIAPLTPLASIPRVFPNNGRAAVDDVVYVNGIMTPLELHFEDMQKLANTGASVVGLHNSTGGQTKDLWNCLKDKLLQSDSKVVPVLIRLLEEAALGGTPLHLVGHSRGGLLIEVACIQVRDRLLRGPVSSEDELSERLQHVKIETLGSGGARFPVRGPRYFHYINELDPVAQFFGTGAIQKVLRSAHLGEGAGSFTFRDFQRTINFDDLLANIPKKKKPGLMDQLVHGPAVYLAQRIPFEEAVVRQQS
ncbi:MAG: hypothetical protein KDD64_14395 [Bdellovibrionales bacterium]|nr:hypothetical protein [Bdellovibrionales bacterium]